MAENVLRDLSYFEGYDTSTSPRKLNPTSPKKQTKQNDRKLRVMEDTPQIKRERLENKRKTKRFKHIEDYGCCGFVDRCDRFSRFSESNDKQFEQTNFPKAN